RGSTSTRRARRATSGTWPNASPASASGTRRRPSRSVCAGTRTTTRSLLQQAERPAPLVRRLPAPSVDLPHPHVAEAEPDLHVVLRALDADDALPADVGRVVRRVVQGRRTARPAVRDRQEALADGAEIGRAACRGRVEKQDATG